MADTTTLNASTYEIALQLRTEVAALLAQARSYPRDAATIMQGVADLVTGAIVAITAAPLPVAGPLTDAELRAAPVPVALAGIATASGQSAILTAIGALIDAIGDLPSDAGAPAIVEGLAPGLAQIVAKLSADPATQTTLADAHARLGDILVKLTADPATANGQAALLTALGAVVAKLSADPATQTTLAAAHARLGDILVKLTADPATAAGLATLGGKLDILHGDLATTLAGLLAASNGYSDGLEALLSGLLSVKNLNGLTVTQSVVPVTAASAQKLAANAARRYLYVENIGTGDVTLGFGAAAVLGAGKPLNRADAAGRQGGSVVFESGGVPTQAIHAVSALGTSLVFLEG